LDKDSQNGQYSLEEWVLLQNSQAASLHKFLSDLRNKALQKLKQHLYTTQEYAVGAALILGDKKELDPALKQSYSITGAMHVLAVSGLHVGFIYLLFNFLLSLVKINHKAWRAVKLVLLIAIIWLFAFITGASPSVSRAACMFTFLAFGRFFNRHTNIYNTLAASAFLLLLINPLFLCHPGFLLSYAALTGILFFQHSIYQLIYIKNKVPDYLWKLVSLSIAAQLTTFPLSLYFFHQMPVFFWLSGMAVVPLAVIILGVGLLVIFFGNVPVLGWLAGKTLYGSIYLLNSIIKLIKEIPGSQLINEVWMSEFGLLMLYLFLSFIMIFIRSKRSVYLHISLLFLLICGSAYAFRDWKCHHQKELVIYHIKKHTAMEIIEGKNAFCLHDPQLASEKLHYASKNYHLFKKIEKAQSTPVVPALETKGAQWFYKNQFVKAGDILIGIHDGSSGLFGLSELNPEYLILSNDPGIDLNEIKQIPNFKLLILDTSNSYHYVKKMKKRCRQLGVHFIDINQEGAFILPF